MAAIITDQFRRNSAKFLLADIANTSTNYYVGLGKSDPWVEDEGSKDWTVQDPTGTEADGYEIKSNLATLLKIDTTNCSLVIPRVDYKTGAYYKAYTPHDQNCFFPETIGGIPYLPCYVVSVVGSNVGIFLCLNAPNGASDTKPTDMESYFPREYGNDGYIWALIDRIDALEMPINTDQYVSINSGKVNTSVAAVVENSSGGILYGFSVLNGGSGYSGGTTLTFTPYTATSTLTPISCQISVDDNGAITAVRLPTNYNYTTGIVNGEFEFGGNSGGTGASIVANITPALGLANNPSNVLPSWFIGVAVKAIEDINSDGFYIPYRQISILKGLSHTQTESGNPSSLAALKYIKLSQANSNLLGVEEGEEIIFGNGSRAFFDSYAEVIVSGSTEYRVYYHQNSKSGYGKIEYGQSDNVISVATYNNIAYSSVSNNEYVPNSGEVVFVENRRAIMRAESQTEEIKIIIQL